MQSLLPVRAVVCCSGLLLSASFAPVHAQPSSWTVDAKPTLSIRGGGSQSDEELAIVVGATRWPDGNILVGDRAAFSMHLFSPAGKELRKFGRQGSGPGELKYPKSLLRCGTVAIVDDIENNLNSVFAQDGSLVRTFRFSSKPTGSVPYNSACNAALFVHYGWEAHKQMKAGVFRTLVPLYTTPIGDGEGKLLANIDGSERWGTRGGARPLPLGRQSHLAIGRDRIYVGENNRYEIRQFTLQGQALDTIRKAVKPIRVTANDIAAELEHEISQSGEKWRKTTESDYRTMVFPKTLPLYRAFVVDHDDNLWVQDFAHSQPDAIQWTVFSNRGKQIAEVILPLTFGVYEIGEDYILGRYEDPVELVPEVRLYHLRKSK